MFAYGLLDDGAMAARKDRHVRRVGELAGLLSELGPVPSERTRSAVIALSRGRYGLRALQRTWSQERLDSAELIAAGSQYVDASDVAFLELLVAWATHALNVIGSRPWFADHIASQARKLLLDRAIHRRRQHLRRSCSRPPGRRDIFQTPAP